MPSCTLDAVVVTGVGAVTPLGIGARTLHERWSAGASGIADGVGACAEFEPRDFLTVKQARRADRFTQFALVAGAEALADAGWDEHEPPLDPRRVGCVVASGIGGVTTLVDSHDLIRERGMDKVSPLAIPLMTSNAAAATLSMRHDLRGPSFAVASACASGVHALGTAMRMIQVGEADAVVAGGSEAALIPMALAAFKAAGALSPSGRSLPFDARRDGFVMGEGAAILVLERERTALARGARVLATLRGYASTSDAFHMTAARDDGSTQAAAISGALADAGLAPDDLDYVNAHGTATPPGDVAETVALKAALGARAERLPVSSTKSAIGHLLGAAGAVEAVATILALRDRIAPPTVGWSERDAQLDLDYVPAARPLALPAGRPARAISNSFGFGGHNAVLCIEAA